MPLSERKKKILKAVVDGYIESATPVSSKEIQEKHLPDCSSATIRNELSALESMGYLVQPHVSAGRAPSEKAFRLYVDELMEAGPLTETEISVIDNYFTKQIDNIEDVVGNVAKVLSEITNYTSVFIKERVKTEKVEGIKLVQLTQSSALLIIVTDNNVFKDNIIDLPEHLDDKGVDKAQKWLNKLFAGRTLCDIASDKNEKQIIADEFSLYRRLYEKVLELLVKLSNCADKEVITQGAGKILEYPEYSDPELAKNFIAAIEQKQQLAEMFEDENNNENKAEFSVKIGQEDETLPEGCSVVSARINFNDKIHGSAGVIGPVRMNYKKVVSVLDHISKLLDNILGDDKKDD